MATVPPTTPGDGACAHMAAAAVRTMVGNEPEAAATGGRQGKIKTYERLRPERLAANRLEVKGMKHAIRS